MNRQESRYTNTAALTDEALLLLEQKYVFAFYTQGTVAIIGKWLEDNCRDDIDMIIDLIARHTTAAGQEGR